MLAHTFSAYQYVYTLLQKKNVGLYSGRRSSGSVSYEVHVATRERPYGSPKGTSCRLGYPSTSQWVDKVFTYRKLENAQEKFNELTKVDHSVMRDAPFYRKG